MRAAAQLKNLPSSQSAAEDGGWSAFLPGTPVAAIEKMIMAIREYAADCTSDLNEHRTTATNQVLSE